MKKLTLIAAVVATSVFSFNAHAERIRYCDGEFWAEPLSSLGEKIGNRVEISGFRGRGRHGGIQANTARERARARIKECFDGPFQAVNNRDIVATCHDVFGLDFSFNELLWEAENRVISGVMSKVRMGWNSSGDNRCGGSGDKVFTITN